MNHRPDTKTRLKTTARRLAQLFAWRQSTETGTSCYQHQIFQRAVVEFAERNLPTTDPGGAFRAALDAAKADLA